MMTSDFRDQQSAFDASTVFRVAPGFQAAALVSQLPCRERWVFLLLDGRRSIAQVARLTQRSELDVASALARFLHLGYIESVHAVERLCPVSPTSMRQSCVMRFFFLYRGSEVIWE